MCSLDYAKDDGVCRLGWAPFNLPAFLFYIYIYGTTFLPMYLNIASHVVILEVYTGAATTEIVM